jgi:hypothetical protein
MPFVSRIAILLLVLISFAVESHAADSEWIQPTSPDGPLVWGRRDGIVFGLPSAKGDWGIPRGLIRVGIYPAGAKGPELLNYIAVEPVVALPTDPNKKGFSELEQSQLDPGKEGKRLWIGPTTVADAYRGKITTFSRGGTKVEVLSVPIDVERFSANGAKVHLLAMVRSDLPNEVSFAVYADADSAVVKELTLTATMGNWERLRLVWLKDQVLDSRKLASAYKETGFAADTDKYPASDMLRTKQGDPIVYASSSETDPQSATQAFWKYPLPKLTQYWSVPADDVQPDLRLRINERDVYWGSKEHVFGGIAFENFELRQRYVPGQTFIFGITRKEPREAYDGPGGIGY